MDARTETTAGVANETDDTVSSPESDAESEEDEALAVDRAYVLEAAEILLDYAHLQETQRFAAKR
ncbi:hypothetical protein HSBAA_45850 [Vreelandella sulfidaeris]|uniref:Uncharacterized protein n=1 Tax=Vreelandella sulfidaeris TaxID=115553 RepID=A0A455UGE2_9GAMM|nr:hypothetical protein HSBAA_45850 [Halomonas sulfidaeris]